MKLNLSNLLYKTPNINPLQVQMALNQRFPIVVAEPRNEDFFNFQIRCATEERNCLIIRYGWSMKKDKWFFEPIKVGK